jgi:hypothetical protein
MIEHARSLPTHWDLKVKPPPELAAFASTAGKNRRLGSDETLQVKWIAGAASRK